MELKQLTNGLVLFAFLTVVVGLLGQFVKIFGTVSFSLQIILIVLSGVYVCNRGGTLIHAGVSGALISIIGTVANSVGFWTLSILGGQGGGSIGGKFISFILEAILMSIVFGIVGFVLGIVGGLVAKHTKAAV